MALQAAEKHEGCQDIDGDFSRMLMLLLVAYGDGNRDGEGATNLGFHDQGEDGIFSANRV